VAADGAVDAGCVGGDEAAVVGDGGLVAGGVGAGAHCNTTVQAAASTANAEIRFKTGYRAAVFGPRIWHSGAGDCPSQVAQPLPDAT